MPPGTTKENYLEMKLHEVLIESPGLDLLVMGRPEGPGCYCYANNILRHHLDRLVNNYPFVVMDNEAGMEHLSRSTTQGVDYLLFLADYSLRGVRTVGQIKKLVEDLQLRVKEKYLVIDRVPQHMDAFFSAEVSKQKLELLGTIPEDPYVKDQEWQGKPLLDLPEESAAVQAVARMMSKII